MKEDISISYSENLENLEKEIGYFRCEIETINQRERDRLINEFSEGLEKELKEEI